VRRDSSTVVVVTGQVTQQVLAEIGRSPNVSVIRPPEIDDPVEAAAVSLREAARKPSAYVLVAADPLAAVAREWRAMWDVSRPGGAAEFERQAAEAVTAWRAGRFELPDYYLVITETARESEGLHLGPVRAARPHRVAVAAAAAEREQAAAALGVLGGLSHGPWWPPLDELISRARQFFAGGLGDRNATLIPPSPS
jgi:hypothetical protein